MRCSFARWHSIGVCKPVLTPEEQAEQDAIADPIIEEILRRRGGGIWIDLESKRPTDANNIPNWVPDASAMGGLLDPKSTQLVADLAALQRSRKLDERNALIDANSVHWGLERMAAGFVCWKVLVLRCASCTAL